MIYKEICINHSKTGIKRNWICTKADKLNVFVKKYQNKEVELYTSYYDFNKDLITIKKSIDAGKTWEEAKTWLESSDDYGEVEITKFKTAIDEN